MITLRPSDAPGRDSLSLLTGIAIPTAADIAFDHTLVGHNWHGIEADGSDFRWMGAAETASVRIVIDRRTDLEITVHVAHVIDEARWGDIAFHIDDRPVQADLRTEGGRHFVMRAPALRAPGEGDAAEDPSETVDAAWYLARYGDVAAAGKDPVEHYTLYGRGENRFPNAAAEARDGLAAQVDAAWYLARYTDVAAAGQDPREHFLLYGRAEGRFPNAAAESRHGLARSILDLGITAPFAAQPGPADPRRLSVAVARVTVRPLGADAPDRERVALTAPALPYLRRLDRFAAPAAVSDL